jgi:glycosyltransferase involved in cell wall biosynthesis
MPDGSAGPQVSVVIRAYNRVPALCELIGEVLAQEHDSFEVVVIEQSTRVEPADRDRLEQLCADPRLRLLRFPPLGGPGAKNEGARAARGDLMLFIDDDDLPGDRRWIARHAANFDDPLCLGVMGRAIFEGGREPPYRDMRRAEARVMSLSWLAWMRPYSRVGVRKIVDSVDGGNVMLRREAMERAGLWDVCTPTEEALSFTYRLRRRMRPGEYLLFDGAATMRRRLDIPGGMDKRYRPAIKVARNNFQFLHRIVGHYFPWRYWLLQPAYLGLLYGVVLEWLWQESHAHDTFARRLWTSTWLALALPFLWCGWLVAEAVRRLREGPLPYEPRLDDPPAARPRLAPMPDVERARAAADLSYPPS